MKLIQRRRKKPLVQAPPEKMFWVHGGQTLGNLRDLAQALSSMSDNQFLCHLNHEKNDFAKWTEEVLEDAECARDLRRSKSKKAALGVVERVLGRYHS